MFSISVMNPETEPVIPGMINLKSETNNSDDDMDAFERKLKKLTKMKEAGILSDEEFAEHKQRLLMQL